MRSVVVGATDGVDRDVMRAENCPPERSGKLSQGKSKTSKNNFWRAARP